MRVWNLIGITLGLCSAVTATAAESRPNILVVLADDMGYSDAGCYGGEIKTPTLDALAAGGLRFRQFYNCSRCCPTRAALLTGQYAHQVGLERNGQSLSQTVPTLAETLGNAGYATAMVGKWHLSQAEALAGRGFDSPKHLAWLNHQSQPGPLFAARDTYPVARGFDTHYGIIWGVIDYFDPFSLVDGYQPVQQVPDDYYLTNALNARAASDIRRLAAGEKPFFMYLAHTAPHWPLHAPQDEIAQYAGKYDAGWQKLRDARYQRQIETGLIDPQRYSKPELQTQHDGDWQSLTPAQRRTESAKMEVHAAMVSCMDRGLADVVAALKETGELDNTLIVFFSDNGASPEIPQGPGYDRPSQTRDGREIRYSGNFPPSEMGRETTYTGIGPAWASAVNTPFRYWKKESFHGGNQTPCIVHWPAGLKTEPGSVTDKVAHVIDIAPTMLELAGIDRPANFKGNTLTPAAGRSFAPLLRGKSVATRERLFFEHEGGAALRQGNWKIVRLNPKSPWELYDLSRDRTETTNLADREPQRLKEMADAWETWFASVHTAPTR